MLPTNINIVMSTDTEIPPPLVLTSRVRKFPVKSSQMTNSVFFNSFLTLKISLQFN